MIRVGIIGSLVFAQAALLAAERIEVPVGAFKFAGNGHYVWKLDRRDLFQIVHPWTTSKAGDFGQMEAEVVVPAGAKPPLTLVFYVMDNNYTGPVQTGADWINRDVRAGHRFRQAIVSGRVVWQQDTCLDDVSQHYLVDISDRVKPGTTVNLAFRLWEAVDSHVSLPAKASPQERRTTTQTLLRAFSNYMLIIHRSRLGREVQPTRLTTRQREILQRLGFDTPAQILSRQLPRDP